MRTIDECIRTIHFLDPSKSCPLLVDMMDLYGVDCLPALTVEQMNEFIDSKIWEKYMSKRISEELINCWVHFSPERKI